MEIIKGLFRYRLSTICMFVTFIVAYLCLFYGNKIYELMILEQADKNEYKYKNETNISVSMDSETINLDDIFATDKGNVKILQFYAFFDTPNSTSPIDIVINDNERELYPIVEGRYPTKKELVNNEKVILLGIDHKDNTFMEDNNTYFMINGEKYKVTGFMSARNSVIYDYYAVAYYKCLGERLRKEVENASFSSLDIAIQSNEYDTNVLYESIRNNMDDNEIFYFLSESIEPMASAVSYGNEKNYYFLIYMFCIINCIIVSEYWIMQRYKEISIRKAYGYTNKKIVFMMYKEIAILALVGSVLAVIIQIIIDFILKKIFNYLVWDVVLYMATIVLFVMISASFVILFPVYKIFKNEPVKYIK